MYLIGLKDEIQVISDKGALMQGRTIVANNLFDKSKLKGFITVEVFDMFNIEPPKSLDEYSIKEREDFGLVDINIKHIISIQEY